MVIFEEEEEGYLLLLIILIQRSWKSSLFVKFLSPSILMILTHCE
jgi:hypothetical protein